uniref:C-type lectin domain-containing protein n=1 Tax=Caenorhabditis tropicalis TaxID=1561998 RepID=A0A1I7T1F2_9PELO
MWFLSTLILVLVVHVSADTCPTGFTVLNTNNKCVKLITNVAKHADASANCTASGGSLISIHNAVDNRAYVNYAASSTTPFWIGLKCSASGVPASCLWDDQSGNAGSYNGFASNYPVVEIGNCVYVPTSGSYTGKWLSGDCLTMSLNYICETPASTPVTDTCSFQFNDNCYFPTLSSLSEQEAQFACQQECGNLVSIHSIEENNYVQSLFTNNAPTYIRIGATTNDQNVNSWLDGSKWDYSNIGYANSNLGSCWSMALSNDIVSAGKWISSKCDTSVPFVCKRKVGTQCGSTAGPTLAPGQCNGPQFYDNSGTFYSPNWPYTYLGQQNPCSYVLDTPVGSLAQIQFPVMVLDSQAAIALYSRIEDTTPIVVLQGNSASNQWYSSTTNTMKVVFHPCITNCPTDGVVYKWQANFKPSNQVTQSPPVIVTPNPNNPSGCNSTILVAPGYISSPNYPQLYPNFSECMYHLSTAGGYRIKIDFGRIDTEQCCDFIVVRDGPFVSSPVLATISGSWPADSKIYQSSSNSMLVSFTSDASGQATGFSATFDRS